LTLVVRKDVGQLLSWTHADGQTGLVHVLNVIARLLQNQDESGGLVIGDLIIHLFRRAGESVLPVLPDLLQAMLVRMQTAQTATFLQSLIIPFAFLVYNHRDAVLDLLESTRVGEEGRSGLDVLLNTWCENAVTFQGFWPTRISALALCTLLHAERPSLQTVVVKGDIIITAATKNSEPCFFSFFEWI
jgi:importin-9